MKYLFFCLMLVVFSDYAMTEKNRNLFSCTATTGEKIKVFEHNDKFRVSIDNQIIDSRDSIENMGEDIIKNDPDNFNYMEFNALDYYITIGNPSNKNGDESLTVSSLKSGLASSKDKKYICMRDYKNNISSLVDDFLEN
ncbi:hypothetical protein [Enterobacter cloacae complex sp. ESBL7]|uniref:hypothetical protein n=1 Tax=Enterobacter cloacae complex sp. ESBL7 TaxID=3163325 RepID=UPI00356B5DA4